jgi:hypothetical protein
MTTMVSILLRKAAVVGFIRKAVLVGFIDSADTGSNIAVAQAKAASAAPAASAHDLGPLRMSR